MKEKREAAQKAKDFRLTFPRNLKMEHPLYKSPPEANRRKIANSQSQTAEDLLICLSA